MQVAGICEPVEKSQQFAWLVETRPVQLTVTFIFKTPLVDVYESLNGFRAILHKSILNAHVGQKVTYASPRFMSATKHDAENIAIERGFRQYGSPIAEVQNFMTVIENESTFAHRICTCQCEKCKDSVHPVYNCLT